MEHESDRFGEVESEALSRVTLDHSGEARLQNIIKELLQQLEPLLKDSPSKPEPILVGSCAKGTYLREPDIDIFIAFPPDTDFEVLEREGLGIGRSLFPDGIEKYAQHPYISGVYREHEVEIVPCFKVDSAASIRSAVDRTPFHTEYIKAHLSEPQRDHVRLLKQFCKGIGVYSADEEVQGFSGYLLELLIIHFGSFHSLLKDARDWTPGRKITLSDRLEPPGGVDPVFEDPFVLIDPVDPKRNVASPLQLHNFQLFSQASSAYLDHLSLNFFFPNPVKPLPIERLRTLAINEDSALVLLSFDRPDILSTALHSQLRKTKRNMISRCESKGFKELASTFAVKEHETEVIILLHLSPSTLPSTKVHEGPPVGHSHEARFLNKWKKHRDAVGEPFQSDGRWKVNLKQDIRRVEDCIRMILKDINFGKDLNRTIRGSIRIESGPDAIREPWLDTITELLVPRKPWEN